MSVFLENKMYCYNIVHNYFINDKREERESL